MNVGGTPAHPNRLDLPSLTTLPIERRATGDQRRKSSAEANFAAPKARPGSIAARKF
jgi:hypothetical protein